MLQFCILFLLAVLNIGDMQEHTFQGTGELMMKAGVDDERQMIKTSVDDGAATEVKAEWQIPNRSDTEDTEFTEKDMKMIALAIFLWFIRIINNLVILFTSTIIFFLIALKILNSIEY